MTLFQLVKATLDILYNEAINVYGAETDARIADAVKYLSSAYVDLTDEARIPVDYHDPVTRFAYVYKYVAAHGDYILQIIESLREISGGPIFNAEKLRLTCIGGGPGSDLLSVLKYLSEYPDEHIKKVTCYLLDGEQAWADTWTELDETLDLSFSLNTNFQRLDVTDPSSWADQKKFLDADVFTISYFVSEVMSRDNDGVVTKFWDTVFSSAKSGAIFLYTDNGAPVFDSYFDNIWKTQNLDILYGYDNVRVFPRFSEEKGDLGEYLKKFGHLPKIQSYVSGRILRKP